MRTPEVNSAKCGNAPHTKNLMKICMVPYSSMGLPSYRMTSGSSQHPGMLWFMHRKYCYLFLVSCLQACYSYPMEMLPTYPCNELYTAFMLCPQVASHPIQVSLSLVEYLPSMYIRPHQGRFHEMPVGFQEGHLLQMTSG